MDGRMMQPFNDAYANRKFASNNLSADSGSWPQHVMATTTGYYYPPVQLCGAYAVGYPNSPCQSFSPAVYSPINPGTPHPNSPLPAEMGMQSLSLASNGASSAVYSTSPLVTVAPTAFAFDVPPPPPSAAGAFAMSSPLQSPVGGQATAAPPFAFSSPRKMQLPYALAAHNVNMNNYNYSGRGGSWTPVALTTRPTALQQGRMGGVCAPPCPRPMWGSRGPSAGSVVVTSPAVNCTPRHLASQMKEWPSCTAALRRGGQEARAPSLPPRFLTLNMELRKDVTLQMVVGGSIVSLFAQTQEGSRFIQCSLEKESDEAVKEGVFKQVVNDWATLSNDVFGNFVVQKLLATASADQKRFIVETFVLGRVVALSRDRFGCRLVQESVSIADAELQPLVELMLAELRGGVVGASVDQNANHVVQRILKSAGGCGGVCEVAQNRYGCRVVQHALEHCPPSLVTPLVEALVRRANQLAVDEFANYVVQQLIGDERQPARVAEQLFGAFSGRIVDMAQQKFASHVVECLLDKGTTAQRRAILDEILNSKVVVEDVKPPREALWALLFDQYGNYVVQRMLDVADDARCLVMCKTIMLNETDLIKYSSGKHIIQKAREVFGRLHQRRAEMRAPERPATAPRLIQQPRALSTDY